MKTTSKTYLIIISTFIMGTISGVLLAPMILRGKPPERERRLDSREGFRDRFEEFLNPTDAQRLQIKAILEKHSLKYMAGRRQMMEQFRLDMDTLKQQLDPILTDEQKKRLEERLQRKPRHKRR